MKLSFSILLQNLIQIPLQPTERNLLTSTDSGLRTKRIMEAVSEVLDKKAENLLPVPASVEVFLFVSVNFWPTVVS